MYFADEWLAAFLVGYFSLWIFAVIFLRAWIVWRRTGVFPVIIERAATAYGFLSRYLFVLTLLSTVVTYVFVAAREYYGMLIPFTVMEYSILRLIGIGIMIAALVLMFVAQAEMGSSWRIGIDTENKTPLVETGLFRLSRNPIYLGLLATLTGFFLVLPNVITFFVLTQGWLAIQIQIRMEEAFLREQHGEAFAAFCSRVRRWI